MLLVPNVHRPTPVLPVPTVALLVCVRCGVELISARRWKSLQYARLVSDKIGCTVACLFGVGFPGFLLRNY